MNLLLIGRNSEMWGASCVLRWHRAASDSSELQLLSLPSALRSPILLCSDNVSHPHHKGTMQEFGVFGFVWFLVLFVCFLMPLQCFGKKKSGECLVSHNQLTALGHISEVSLVWFSLDYLRFPEHKVQREIMVCLGFSLSSPFNSLQSQKALTEASGTCSQSQNRTEQELYL